MKRKPTNNADADERMGKRKEERKEKKTNQK